MDTPSALSMPARPSVAYIGCALLLVALVPPLLMIWATRLDAWIGLPVYGTPTMGAAVAGAGLLLILAALTEIRTRGKNGAKLIRPAASDQPQGIHTFLTYPLHLGTVLLSLGISLATRSAAGIWIVSPTLALASVALVLGRRRTQESLASAESLQTRLRMPPNNAERPDKWDRGFIYAKVLLPWILLYMAIEFLGVPPDAIDGRFEWELQWPVLPWTEPLYLFTYPFVMLAPLAAHRKSELRRFAVRAYWAMGLLFSLYLLTPIIAQARPVPGEGFLQNIMQLERKWDRPITAFPSFHVVWACIAASLYTATWPRLAWLAWLLAAGISITCVTTGMHASIDVVAGFLAFALIANGRRVGTFIHNMTRRAANGGVGIARGRIRIPHAGLLSAAGVSIGIIGAGTLAGSASLGWLAALAVVAILGATLPQQILPKRHSLPPTSDYFIAVVGVSPFAALAAHAGAPVWLLLAAAGIGAGLAESVAGLKVLRNGHGASDQATPAGPDGLPLALYRSARAFLVSIILIRLWLLAVPLGFLVGLYLILTGLGRFVEERARSGPARSAASFLHPHQWFAIGMVVFGIFLTTAQSPHAPAPAGFVPAAWMAAAVIGLATLAVTGLHAARAFRQI